MSAVPPTLIEALEKGISLRLSMVDAIFLNNRSNVIGAIIEGVGAPYTEDKNQIAKYFMKLPERFPELETKIKCPEKNCDHGEGYLINIMLHLEEDHGSSRNILLQWLRHLKKIKVI
jgi:hypothetical protein